MKIYMSEKEIKENDLNFMEDEFVEKYWLLKGDSEDDVSFEVYDDVGMVEIKSLEQHDKKIRNQVIDEVLELIKKDLYYVWESYNQEYEDLEQKLTEMKGETK